MLALDPLIHRLSVKGIKTKIPLYESSPERLKQEALKFKKKEQELFNRYATYKSAEKSSVYRWIRLKQLERRKKFLDTALDKKQTYMTHKIYDLIQRNKEQVILQNKYGKRVIDITPSDKQLAKESKHIAKDDRMFNYAQKHRFETRYGKKVWKDIVNNLKRERQTTDKEIAYIKLKDEQSKFKIKKDEQSKVTFMQALDLSPIGRLLKGGRL